MREKLNMKKFFNRNFIRLKPEIAPGVCPHCDEISSFISIVNDHYKCMSCGLDVEQKINGVIKYLPIGGDSRLENGSKKT